MAPVLNKVRALLRSPFLRPLLCARRTTLEFARLWHEPQLVLVRLDRTALGEECTRLLAGLLCHTLLQTALRARGRVPVVLAIDELPMLERFVGGALQEIATVARSQRLRLLVACQHLDQLSEELRAALLANAAVQLFFRLGHADARLVAASLAAGTEPRIARVVATIDRRDRQTGRPELTRRPHRIRDAGGKPLQVSVAVWQHLRWNDLFGRDLVRELQALARATGFSRLYVRAADTGEPVELSHYVARLKPEEYWIEGPRLTLVVGFPRPRLTGVERWSESEAVRHWTATLQALATQQAVLRLSGKAMDTVRVVNVPTPTIARDAYQAYTTAALRAHGQSRLEIEATLAAREAEVVRLAGGRIEPEEVDDGSLF